MDNLPTYGRGNWYVLVACAVAGLREILVDACVKACNLKPKNGCKDTRFWQDISDIERIEGVTPGLLLEGSHNWDPLLYIHLVQDYGMEVDVAQHLANTYGDRAFVVARMCKMTGIFLG